LVVELLLLEEDLIGASKEQEQRQQKVLEQEQRQQKVQEQRQQKVQEP
jgi:hypothetical protein